MSGKAEGYTRAGRGRPAQFSAELSGLKAAMFWAATHMHMTGLDWSVRLTEQGWEARPDDETAT